MTDRSPFRCYPDTVFTYVPPMPEQADMLADHYAKVRAGIHIPQAHKYTDDRAKLVEMHHFLANDCAKAAVHHMKKVEEFSQ